MRHVSRIVGALAAFATVLGMTGFAAAVPITIVDNLPGTWDDLSADGIPLSVAGDGEDSFVSPRGNLVFPVGTITVGENGGLAFGIPPDTDLEPTNAPIPSLLAFGGGQSILAYWDDLDATDYTRATTCAGTKSPGPARSIRANRTTVVWNRVCRRNAPLGEPPDGDTVTFQVQIFDPPVGPQGILAQILYLDIESPAASGGASATIGYQDGGAGHNDSQWSFDTPFAVHDGTVLSILPEPACVVLIGLVAVGVVRRRRLGR